MNPVTGLSIGRIVIGVVSLAAPRLAARVFSLDLANNPQLSYMARMFGSREIALGVITLAAPARARKPLVLGGIAVDAADAAAGMLAGSDRVVGKRTAALLVAPAIAAVVAGVVGVRR